MIRCPTFRLRRHTFPMLRRHLLPTMTHHLLPYRPPLPTMTHHLLPHRPSLPTMSHRLYLHRRPLPMMSHHHLLRHQGPFHQMTQGNFLTRSISSELLRCNPDTQKLVSLSVHSCVLMQPTSFGTSQRSSLDLEYQGHGNLLLSVTGIGTTRGNC